MQCGLNGAALPPAQYNPAVMRTRSRFPTLIAVAFGAVGIGFGAIFLLNAPRVVAVSPAADALRVSSLAPVEIVFSRPMNEDATAAAFHVEPPQPGQINWPSPTTLRFVPQAEWPQGVSVRATLSSQARSARGLPVLGGADWEFTAAAARVAYLQLEPDGLTSNVWSVLLDGSERQRITDEPFGVNEFDVSPDGTRVVYSAVRADGGADLYETTLETLITTQLLACPGEECRNPRYAPDGQKLGFERRVLADGEPGGRLPGSSISIVVVETGELLALPVPDEEVSHSPNWMFTGNLSFVNETLRAIGWYNPQTGALDYAPSFAVEMGAWSPDGQWLVYSEILLQEHTHEPATDSAPETDAATPSPEQGVAQNDVFYTHLLRYNITSGQLREITDIQFVEDTAPAFSPSGRWLAYARKFVDAENWTPGRQLWVADANGANARQLTDAGIYNHSAFVWSPDEQTLVYMRFNVADFNAPPEIWAIETDGSNARLLAEGGALPRWLP